MAAQSDFARPHHLTPTLSKSFCDPANPVSQVVVDPLHVAWPSPVMLCHVYADVQRVCPRDWYGEVPCTYPHAYYAADPCTCPPSHRELTEPCDHSNPEDTGPGVVHHFARVDLLPADADASMVVAVAVAGSRSIPHCYRTQSVVRAYYNLRCKQMEAERQMFCLRFGAVGTVLSVPENRSLAVGDS